MGEGVIEEFEKEDNRNTMSKEEVPAHKKEEILEHSRILSRAQVEEGKNIKLRPHHHPYDDK